MNTHVAYLRPPLFVTDFRLVFQMYKHEVVSRHTEDQLTAIWTWNYVRWSYS